MAKDTTNELSKLPFSPSDKELTLLLSTIFRSYYPLTKLINGRYRSYSGLRPTSIPYLCVLYSYPDGLKINEVMEILSLKGNPRKAMIRLVDLGYLSRKKGKIRGSYNLTPDIYYLTLSGNAVVESILDSIKR